MARKHEQRQLVDDEVDELIRAMRRHDGERFAIISMRTVFGLQGLMMSLVALPVQLGQTRHTSIGVVAIIGLVVWTALDGRRRPGYEDDVRNTSSFIPRPRRTTPSAP